MLLRLLYALIPSIGDTFGVNSGIRPICGLHMRCNALTVSGWLGVEVRHLAALAAVSEECSFRGAADRLGYVQSAVSQRIAQLERLVGVRLVDRSRGQTHVKLTVAGEALLHHAEQILSQLNAAQADLRTLTSRDGRPALNVGVIQSLATRILPGTLAMLAEREPDLRVDAREASSDAGLCAAVEAGELDVAFAELPLVSGRFKTRTLLRDPLVLVVPAGSPLTRWPSPPQPAEIAEQALVVDPTWRMIRLVEAEFRAAGVALEPRFNVTGNAGVQALVGAGLGVAIMARLAVDPDDPTIEVIDMDGVLPARTLVCYWQSDRRHVPALAEFVDAAEAVCAELSVARTPAQLAA